MRLATLLSVFVLSSACVTAAAAADKYTWDGYGTGTYSKCFTYGMHIEFVVEGGMAKGWWQQKDRVVRPFELPVGADGSFAGKIDIGPADMNVSGSVGASPEIKLRGYCNFGGPLKKQ